MAIDMSMELTPEVCVFPGYPPFEAEQLQTYESDGKRSHRLTLNTHMGTHVDAPAHFIEDGRRVDQLSVDELCGLARVVDLRAQAGDVITGETLEQAVSTLEEQIVLLLTGDVDRRFGDETFFEEAAVLDHSAAKWLVEQGVKVVANDFLTEAVDTPTRPVHTELLGADVPIVEYLCNVDEVLDSDVVEFACYPLSIPDVEAAPVRAVCER